MSSEDWSVELSRSGGFAGVTLRSQLAADELAPEEREDWEHLLDHLNELQSAGRRARGGPDRFQYDVTLRRGGRSRHLVLAEEELTPQAQELVTRLMERRRRRR